MSLVWEEDDFYEPKLESQATPDDGKVYTMYHGTSRKAAVSILRTGFRQSKHGMLGPGVYLSRDPEKARRYPLDLPEPKRVVLIVKVNVGRVKAINRQSHPMQMTWHRSGYDTAWCPPHCGMVDSGLEEDCVWDPERVKVMGVLCPKAQPNKLWAEDDLFSLPEPVLKSFNQPEDRKVYIMYHGTSGQAVDSIQRTGFRPSKDGMLGPGVYLSRDLKKASRYPLDLPVNERAVLRVRVDVGRVIKIDRQGHPKQKTWHSYGYDTAWCPPMCGMVKSGLEEDCVWDASRIKVTRVIKPNLDNF